jgi:cytoskeletal protein CcmA (bactofilin family)
MGSMKGQTKIIRCCHCEGMMRVPARALSTACPHCHTRVNLESLTIVGSHPGRRLATCGDIDVEATARLNIDLVGERIRINGRVRGLVRSRQPVEVGPRGVVQGDIHAPGLIVAEGGIIEGRFHRTASAAATSSSGDQRVVADPAGVCARTGPVQSGGLQANESSGAADPGGVKQPVARPLPPPRSAGAR